MIQIGTPAPDFALPDQTGKTHSLSMYKGKWIVVYFYPKDNTPGCTKEACSFRDENTLYQKNTIVVLGISKDSESSHKNFSSKLQLPFPILSDPTHTVIEKYDAWKPKKFMGKEFLGTLRKTILIDPSQIIRKIYTHVDVQTHAQEILSDIKTLNP
jgi:peroxiredoxin Q/BCP